MLLNKNIHLFVSLIGCLCTFWRFFVEVEDVCHGKRILTRDPECNTNMSCMPCICNVCIPCMFGRGLLQTAGGRLLLSSFHKRDRNLRKWVTWLTNHKRIHIETHNVRVWVFTFYTSFILQNFIDHLFWEKKKEKCHQVTYFHQGMFQTHLASSQWQQDSWFSFLRNLSVSIFIPF